MQNFVKKINDNVFCLPKFCLGIDSARGFSDAVVVGDDYAIDKLIEQLYSASQNKQHKDSSSNFTPW